MKNQIIGVFIATLLLACSTEKLTSKGSQVIVSPNPAPQGCKLLGPVSSDHGNNISNQASMPKNNKQGAFNSIRDKAASLGGNYVQMLTATLPFNNGIESTNTTTDSGNAYACPKEALPI